MNVVKQAKQVAAIGAVAMVCLVHGQAAAERELVN